MNTQTYPVSSLNPTQTLQITDIIKNKKSKLGSYPLWNTKFLYMKFWHTDYKMKWTYKFLTRLPPLVFFFNRYVQFLPLIQHKLHKLQIFVETIARTAIKIGCTSAQSSQFCGVQERWLIARPTKESKYPMHNILQGLTSSNMLSNRQTQKQLLGTQNQRTSQFTCLGPKDHIFFFSKY